MKFTFWSTTLVAYCIFLVVTGAVSLVSGSYTVFGESVGYGTTMLYSLLLYTAASLRIVGPTELGCRLFLGKPINNVSSGLVFVPLLFCQLAVETVLVIQDELPTDPEKIYRGSGDDTSGNTVPKELQALGMKPPIRITFSGRNAESVSEGIDENDPYDRRLNAEVVPVIRWRIKNFLVFLSTIGSVESARKQMEDTCVKTFTELLTKVSPAVALCRIKIYSEELQKNIETLVNGWGVHIENAQIKAINFTHTLNEAVQNVVVKERGKQADILEGQGRGGKEQAILEGRTAGFAAMKKRLRVGGELIIGAETARAIAGEGDKSSQRTIIAGSSGFADLIGTAAAIGEGFRTKQGGASS